jgi:WD40 repeat protein
VFSPDGSLLAAYSEPEVLAVYPTKTGRQLTRLKLPGKMPFAGLAFTPDCRSLAVESHDGTVVLWELATGKERRVFAGKEAPAKPVPGGKPSRDGNQIDPFAAPCASVIFSPSGHVLVYGAPDGAIHVWQVQTGQELAVFRGHNGVVNAFAFSADGKTLASASADTTVLTWDLNSRRVLLNRPGPHARRIGSWAASSKYCVPWANGRPIHASKAGWSSGTKPLLGSQQP